MYLVAISFAAAAIAISCIATDASAGGRGASASGGHSPPASANKPSGGTTVPIPRVGGAGDPGRVGTSGSGAASTTGSSAAGAVGGGAPASYYGNPTACGRYPYPPCKKVPARWSPGRSILMRARCLIAQLQWSPTFSGTAYFRVSLAVLMNV